MLRWRSCRDRASTISGTTRRDRPTTTCGIAGRACTRSCAPITTTRAPTGGRTSRSGCKAGPPRNWRRCRPITSWTWARRWRRRWRTRCRPPPRSPRAVGCPTASLPSIAGEYRAQWLRRRAAMVSARYDGARHGGTATVRRPDDRCAVDVHRRQQRLGHLSAARRDRTHAGERVHANAGLPSDRRRRPLGAAGAGGEGKRAAGGVPAAESTGG